MSADTAWLIEHTKDPRYGRESWYSGKDGFTIDSLQAVRFARKEDAVREIDRFPATLAKNLIAAHHSWIPARVCPHGQLQRQCEICEATEEAAHWRSKAENAFEPIRKIADALAQGGFHCHDKPGFVADHVPSLVNEALTELKSAQATVAQLRTELSFESRRLNALWSGEKVLRERAESRFGAANEIIQLSMALAEANVINRDLSESIAKWQEERNRSDKEIAELRARVAELEGMVPRWCLKSETPDTCHFIRHLMVETPEGWDEWWLIAPGEEPEIPVPEVNSNNKGD